MIWSRVGVPLENGLTFDLTERRVLVEPFLDRADRRVESEPFLRIVRGFSVGSGSGGEGSAAVGAAVGGGLGSSVVLRIECFDLPHSVSPRRQTQPFNQPVHHSPTPPWSKRYGRRNGRHLLFDIFLVCILALPRFDRLLGFGRLGRLSRLG